MDDRGISRNPVDRGDGRSRLSRMGLGLSPGCPEGSGRSPGVSGGFYSERFGFSSTKNLNTAGLPAFTEWIACVL